jgi:hypothetical protein
MLYPDNKHKEKLSFDNADDYVVVEEVCVLDYYVTLGAHVDVIDEYKKTLHVCNLHGISP